MWTDITAGMVHFGDVNGDAIELVRSLNVGAMSGPVTPLPEAGAGWIMAKKAALPTLPRMAQLPSWRPRSRPPHCLQRRRRRPAGNLWAGSMGRNGILGAGRLWCFDTNGSATVALEGIGISNGLDFTADGRTAYYVDTTTGTLERLDIGPAGTITGRHCIVTFLPGEGDPDGLVLDDEGCIWVAMWDGWAVRRYSPGGEMLAVVSVPVARPTAVCFAGDLLVITTCSGWLPEDWKQNQPDAGRLFTARVGASGPPARAYRGPLAIALPGEGKTDERPDDRSKDRSTGRRAGRRAANRRDDVGETMAVVAPARPEPLEMAADFILGTAGAESNVAQYLAECGHKVAWASRVGMTRSVGGWPKNLLSGD
ncbi:SMP-30/gluconolactonase/LRE family protein [Arthrobacter alpinus]|nr:SMP-30/gluconolactonase/LRE family protein [Arthrobacter alpinus]